MVDGVENFTAVHKSELTVVEESLPARLGISREVLRTLRQVLLTEGTHWAVQKKRVWLSEVAVALLEAGFTRLKNARAEDIDSILKNGPHAGRAQGDEGAAGLLAGCAISGKVAHIEGGNGWGGIKTPMPAAAAVAVATVVNFSRVTNPKVILARLPGGKEVLVRVNDRRFWRAGMAVRVRQASAGSSVWERVGRDPLFEGEKIRNNNNGGV
jgi:hypothetical protein